MKPLTMTVETARDRALLIIAQDTDAPNLTDRLDAECMRVLVAEVDALRAALADERKQLTAALEDERRHADALDSAAELFREHSGCGCCAGDRRYEALEALNALHAAHAARRAAEVAND